MIEYKNAKLNANCNLKCDGGYNLDITTKKCGEINLKVLQLKTSVDEAIHLVFDRNGDKNLLFMFVLNCARDGWDLAENVCEVHLGKDMFIMYDDYYEGTYEEIMQYIISVENDLFYGKTDALYDEISKNWG